MLQIQTELVASASQPASEYQLFPELFVEAVNRYWLPVGNVVVRVMRENQHRTLNDWVDLGRRITAELLASGTYAGLCFDGNPCFDGQVLRWLHTIQEGVQRRGVADGVVELKWIMSPHATLPGRGNLNTTWTSFQAVNDAEWLHNIWLDAEGDLFHYGCDLLLSVYATNVWGENPWERPLTVATFLTTLEHASGWVIPLGHDHGFLVGLRPESPLYQRLSSTTI